MAELSGVKPIFEYNDESHAERLSRKSKESPFMIMGLAGLATALGVGVYKFKRRGNMTTSMFLMQLRVAAQGTVVGALTAGIAYQMITRYVLHSDEKDEK